MTRAVTFWNDETIRLIQDHFIAASVPTWVCRKDGPEGEFLRKAGIHRQWVTSSGYMNCISADGTLLGKQPCAEVLEAFQELPESQRKPGAVIVPTLSPDEALIPSPPKGGLVLRVHARFLAQNTDSGLRPATPDDFPLMRDKPEIRRSWQTFLQPNTEYMWLTETEWQSLIPIGPFEGMRVEVDGIIAERMARFHLTPQRATTSEGGIRRRKSIQETRLALIVREITNETLRMQLQGFIHWGTHFDASRAATPNGPLGQGFETQLYGHLKYDMRKRVITRFDIVAPGYVWGRWGDANGKSMYVERPGRSPFGFAFELATGDSPRDRIPPGGNGRYTEETGYFRTD